MTTTVNFTCTGNNNHHDLTFVPTAGDPGAAVIWPNGVPGTFKIQMPGTDAAYAANFVVGNTYNFDIPA